MNKYLSQDQIERRIIGLIDSQINILNANICTVSSKENPDVMFIKELEDLVETYYISLLYFEGLVSNNKKMFFNPIKPIEKLKDYSFNAIHSLKVCVTGKKPLYDKELQIRILNWLEVNNKYDHEKALEFIENDRLDKFEEICRYHHQELSRLGYRLTKGKTCTYNEDGNEFISSSINSEGECNGEYKQYSKNGILTKHYLYLDGNKIKDYLKNK